MLSSQDTLITMSDNIGSLIIRAATAEDAAAAVPLIYSSGPEVWDYLMGDGSPESSLPFLHNAWVSGKGVAGYKAHCVAERDGQVLGAIAVYSAKAHKAMGAQTFVQAVKYWGLGVIPRIYPMSRVGRCYMRPPAANVDYVANFGVAAAARGQGVGTAMLAHFLERAKQRGKQFFELDVSVDNPRGQALYERFGMQVVADNHDPYFEKRGLTGSRRMQMSVPAAR
jgi:ribosomal protein S18 acetylase RimI-like enzyme